MFVLKRRETARLEVFLTAAAADVLRAMDSPAAATFQVGGRGTLYIAAGPHRDGVLGLDVAGASRSRVDDLSVAADGSSVLGRRRSFVTRLTLDGGIFQYSGATASSPMPITSTSAGGTIEVSNAATTLTYTGRSPPPVR